MNKSWNISVLLFQYWHKTNVFFLCDAKSRLCLLCVLSSLSCNPVNLTPVNPCLLGLACWFVCFLLFCPSPFVCFSVFSSLSLVIIQSQQMYVLCGSCRYTAGWCFGVYSWSVPWEQWLVTVSLQQALLVHKFYFVITLLQYVLVKHSHVDPYITLDYAVGLGLFYEFLQYYLVLLGL